LKELITLLRQKKPLVHHITNEVTISECANVTLNIGALPVMAHAREEVSEMVAAAGALVLNIGTLTPQQVEAMLIAGKAANQKGISVVLDPVGAGATKLRTQSARRLLNELDVAVIKGNGAEISILAGREGKIRGVESLDSGQNLEEVAAAFARQHNTVVVVSGKEDIVTDGKRLAYIKNGHSLMGQVVGTGCMLASVIGSFLGVEKDFYEAAKYAVLSFCIAGELAAERENVYGPGTYKAAFFDTLSLLDDEKVKTMSVYEEKEVL
jgi:hydroxyethylthiazole kinase